MSSIPFRNSRSYLVCALSLVLPWAMRHGWGDANTVTNQSRSTARQILDRSEPICTALAPDRDDLTISADYTVLRPLGEWTVCCTDASGRETASLQWDDADGTLLSAGAPPRTGSRTGLVLRTANQVMVSARRWLDLLGYSRGQGRPKLRCVRQRHYYIVICRFESHDIVLHIDPSNGLLSFARITPKGSTRILPMI